MWSKKRLIKIRKEGKYHYVCLRGQGRSLRKSSRPEETIMFLVRKLYQLRAYAAASMREEAEKLMIEVREYLLNQGYLSPDDLRRLELRKKGA